MLFRSIKAPVLAFKEHAVVVFVLRDDEVLLIIKKRGMGAGKVNGPGGKLEIGESYVEAAIRETHEEVGLSISRLEHRASLGFIFKDGYSLYGQVFFTRSFTGELIETDEALPFWNSISNIPYEKMWADDILWLPKALNGSYMEGVFTFDGDRLLNHQISEVPAVWAI